ncbi:hypothetical protein OHC33_004408 [Knufia fluminis]|uniref:Major facilitator superfamily (MFS) profile domain-containing protein n=1 Tax=Knufia fluminis TaxID=191047 RepID=A0AAN8EFU0_9EURO|nr:hypothetical protein OHC33_004408 [Knufia fluminis]
MSVDEKMASTHTEEKSASTLEKNHHNDQQLERIDTVNVDNYHGIDLRTFLVYMALCLVSFAQLFNIVGSGAYSRSIAIAIGGADKTVWLSQAIVITTVVLGPPASQAADYFGRKWLIVISAVFGFVGALILSRANSIGQAIGGQVVSSVLYIGQPIVIAVGSEILPRKFRPVAQGGLNAAGAAGGISGLLGGAALTSNSLYGWRNYWYIVAALLGASAIIVAVLYNPPPRPLQKSLSMKEKLGRLDWIAYVLLAICLVLFTVGLSYGNNPYPWTNARVLAPLIVGFCFFVGLIVHQTYLKKDGLIHHGLFKKDRNFAVALGCFFADGMIFWAANNYFSFQVQVLYETDPMLIGLRFCIAFFAAIGAAASIVVISSFTKSIREPIVASFIMFTIFYALMATSKLSSGTAMWGYPVFLGIGLGWSLTYLVTAAQLNAPPHLIAITSGILLAIRSFGGSVALAIYTAIFNSSLSKHLGHDIAAAVLPLGFPPTELDAFIGALAGQDQAALAQIPNVTREILGAGVHALLNAHLVSLRGVWIAAAVFSGDTVIGSCFIINPKSDLNNHVDAPLEE